MFKKSFYWLVNHLLGTYLPLALLVLFGGAITSYAALTTSYETTNLPQMYLDVSISNTQTSNIKLSPLQRNSVTVTFPNTSGGVLRIRQGTRVEDIAYSSASVDSVTKVVTLSDVTRNVCWNNANSLATCGDGLYFSKGAIVELSVDARLLNFKLNRDRTNTASTLFSIRSTQTNQPWLFPNGVTTAQSTAFTYGKGSTDYHIVFDTTLGAMKYWNGSSYVNFGSGSTTNASETEAGKMQVGTLAHLKTLTGTGSSGAQNVLAFKWIVKNGSGSVSAGRVPSLNHNGAVSPSLGGTGTGSTQGIATGAILVGQKNNRMKPLYPGTAGNVIKTTDGTNWTVGTAPTEHDMVSMCVTSSTATGASSTQVFKYDTCKYTIPAGELVAGVGYEFEAAGTFVRTASNLEQISLYIANTRIGTGNITAASAADWRIEGSCMGTAAAGASVAVRCTSFLSVGSSTIEQTATVYASTNLATNGTLLMEFGGNFDASNAANSSTLTMGKYRKISTSSF